MKKENESLYFNDVPADQIVFAAECAKDFLGRGMRCRSYMEKVGGGGVHCNRDSSWIQISYFNDAIKTATK